LATKLLATLAGRGCGISFAADASKVLPQSTASTAYLVARKEGELSSMAEILYTNSNNQESPRLYNNSKKMPTKGPQAALMKNSFVIRDVPSGCNPTPIPTEDAGWQMPGAPKRYDQTLEVEELEDEFDPGLTEEYVVSNLQICAANPLVLTVCLAETYGRRRGSN
jgi:hypothetical protein